jgi:hypothetical protein
MDTLQQVCDRSTVAAQAVAQLVDAACQVRKHDAHDAAIGAVDRTFKARWRQPGELPKLVEALHHQQGSIWKNVGMTRGR